MRSTYRFIFMQIKLKRPRSIYQYSEMATRISGQTSIFGGVFFVSESVLGIVRQQKLKKFVILTRKPRIRVTILMYRTWPIPHQRFCPKICFETEAQGNFS